MVTLFNSKRRVRQKGVSLIETLVGITIGIFITLVVAQVWGLFENQKQITITGSAAQNTGILAMTEMEQDLRSAGAGLTNSASFNCTTTYSYYSNNGTETTPIPAYSGSMAMAPVQITDGGTGPDTIVIKSSPDALSGMPTTLTQTMPQSSSELNVSSTSGFNIGDVVLAVGASGNCTVMQITQVQSAAQKIQHNPGGTTTYNPTTAEQNSWGWPAFVTNDIIVKVGQMSSRQYSINANRQLVLTDNSSPGTSTTSVVASDIVTIKAQYGIANAGSQDVNAWVNAVSSNGFDSLNATKLKRIKAIRIAVVARASKLNATNVTSSCTNTSGTVNNGPCVWPDVTGSPAPVINLSTDANWQKYRYRVYQTIIPLKNVIWASV